MFIMAQTSDVLSQVTNMSQAWTRVRQSIPRVWLTCRLGETNTVVMLSIHVRLVKPESQCTRTVLKVTERKSASRVWCLEPSLITQVTKSDTSRVLITRSQTWVSLEPESQKNSTYHSSPGCFDIFLDVGIAFVYIISFCSLVHFPADFL